MHSSSVTPPHFFLFFFVAIFFIMMADLVSQPGMKKLNLAMLWLEERTQQWLYGQWFWRLPFRQEGTAKHGNTWNVWAILWIHHRECSMLKSIADERVEATF